MTISIVQTCNKCKKERPLTATSSSSGQITANHMLGGWRPFDDKHVCPDCLNAFVQELR